MPDRSRAAALIFLLAMACPPGAIADDGDPGAEDVTACAGSGDTSGGCAFPTFETITFSSGNLAVPIPATGTVGSMTPVVFGVVDRGVIADVNVRLRLNHTFDGDLDVILRAPDGTPVLLMDQNGGSGDNLGTGATDCGGAMTWFDDSAMFSIASGAAPFNGSFTPVQPLYPFQGAFLTGNWKLEIVDASAGDSGTLFCVVIQFLYVPPIPLFAGGFNAGNLNGWTHLP